jgi:NADH-quinone oxidoreductase subunit N
MWTPDVYQGAPTVVTGFMAAASKVAAFAALIRFLDASMPLSAVWIPILTLLAVVTMTVGNLIALAQKDAKRILAYSSIAQAGYILVGIVAWAKATSLPDVSVGFTAVIYYLIAYSFTTIGAFAVLSVAAQKGKEGTLVEDLNGMWRRAPFPAAMMIIFMASLAGIPITGGFFGKLFIFQDAVQTGMLWLALVLAVNSVISVAYYLRIVQATLKDPDVHPTRFGAVNVGLFAACFVCALGVFGIAVFADPLLRWISGG